MNKFLYKLYGKSNNTIRRIIRKIVSAREGGEPYSHTLRSILRDYHGVDIGMYTHGACFIPGRCDRFTTIGRYCSIAANVRVLNRNHPMDFKSTHGFFFNPLGGYTKEHLVDYTPLSIGNDVWIGFGAIIMPSVSNIADGVVIAAGAVLNKDVPPYAVVVGNPARVVRYRFSKEVINELLESKWWEKDMDEIKPYIEEYQQPYEK